MPEGWRWERLPQAALICDHLRRPINNSERLKRNAGKTLDELYPYYGATGQAGVIDDYLAEGDYILLGEDGAPFLEPFKAKAYAVSGRFWVNNHAHVLKGKPHLDARLLLHWLNTIKYDPYVNGTTRLKLTQGAMMEMPVPIPPEELQPVLAARIDELFAEIDDGEAALARARDDLATWRKALLKAAVTGELTADWRTANPPTETGADLLARILADRRARWEAEPMNRGKRYKEPLSPNTDGLPLLPQGWAWASFDQLVAQLSNGISRKPAHMPPGVPILRISSVRPMLVRDDQIRWLPGNFVVAGALAKNGDLLFTRYNGNPELVGVCGRFRGETPIAYPDKVMCAPLSSANDIVGDFLELAMNAGASRNHIAAHTKTSAGQHGVAGSSVKTAPVPIPPEAELEHVVRVYRDATAQAEEGWSDADDLTTVSSTLRQSILAAAFRGDLA